MWDAGQYLKFADERGRPFFDLLARVRRDTVNGIVDLGCGPGNLTRTLSERWPAARVGGVDSSAEMLQQAAAGTIPGRLEFVHADIATWQTDRAVDLIVSNAAWQWVADHENLLKRYAGMLTPGGTLAVQMPYHFECPAHRAIDETKADPRWRADLQGIGLQPDSVHALPWYIDRLHDLGFTVDAWQTTYIHVLRGPEPVLEWFKGSALRPLLQRLAPSAANEFLQTLGARLAQAYPPRDGVTLLPFPRVFFVATR
jgi:trans-aconitate 2-methyltransferase